MQTTLLRRRPRPPRRAARPENRRGAAAVEFALVAPIFMLAMLGMYEASRLYNAQNLLSTAAREGARLASMDRRTLLEPGESTNDKIEQDVRNFLKSQGLPGDDVNVLIVHADNPEVEFDLDDADNNLELFELRIELDYGDLNPLYDSDANGEFKFSAGVVFRNGRAAIVQ